MRILFLTDSAPDYLADLLYIGLCRILGEDRVVDFPPKAVYHQPERRVHYIPQVPAHGYREVDVIATIRDRQFEMAVLSSTRSGVTAAFDSISRQVEMPPTVMLDGEDDVRVRYDLWKRFRAALYFKRELKPGRTGGWWQRLPTGGRLLPDFDRHRLHPLQFSVALGQVPVMPSSERYVDVSYSGRVSHPKRREAVDLLSGASGIRFEGGIYAEADDRRSKLQTGLQRLWTKLTGDPLVSEAERGAKLTPGAYYELLSRSKMALAIRGGGFDTLRYWEIPATHTLLLSEKPDIEIPHNFVHGQHALFFKPDLSDLIDVVRTYAKDELACRTMAQQGYEHLLRHHTCDRRAEYFLETCRRLV